MALPRDILLGARVFQSIGAAMLQSTGAGLIVGAFPANAVAMISRLIDQYRRWTPNTSIPEILQT